MYLLNCYNPLLTVFGGKTLGLKCHQFQETLDCKTRLCLWPRLDLLSVADANHQCPWLWAFSKPRFSENPLPRSWSAKPGCQKQAIRLEYSSWASIVSLKFKHTEQSEHGMAAFTSIVCICSKCCALDCAGWGTFELLVCYGNLAQMPRLRAAGTRHRPCSSGHAHLEPLQQ